MLARSGKIPVRGRWAFEPKLDGFRAIVSSCGALRVMSRRGWNMTKLLPELGSLPDGLILDGELVALIAGKPHFPTLCARILHGDSEIRLCLYVFDVLSVAGISTAAQPYHERAAILVQLEFGAHARAVATFEDGEALFAAVCEHELEGVVAKRLDEPYRPGERRWVKVKNPDYWRRSEEVEGMRRSLERRGRLTSSRSAVTA
jgi:bifunctional non-homologous end joining protein LigD